MGVTPPSRRPFSCCVEFYLDSKCFTGKFTTRKIHTKLRLELEVVYEDIDDFTDIKFVS